MTPNTPPPLDQFGRFRVLLDIIPHPAIVKDAQGRLALANEAAAKLWNRTPEELVGLTASELLDPASACWAEAVDTIMLHSHAPKLLRRAVKVPGQEQSFRASVAPVYLTPEQHVDGIIVVVEPIGKNVSSQADSPDVISKQQLAELVLLKCQLREAEQKSQSNQRLLDAIFDRGAQVVPGDWNAKPLPAL